MARFYSIVMYLHNNSLGSYVTMRLLVARLLDMSLLGMSGWKALLFADSRYSSGLSVALAFLLGLRSALFPFFFLPERNLLQ